MIYIDSNKVQTKGWFRWTLNLGSKQK